MKFSSRLSAVAGLAAVAVLARLFRASNRDRHGFSKFAKSDQSGAAPVAGHRLVSRNARLARLGLRGLFRFGFYKLRRVLLKFASRLERAQSDSALLRTRRFTLRNPGGLETFDAAGRLERLESDFQMQTAEDVTRELGNMKGAMMKIGQMASYLDTGLPDSVRQTMSSLQSDAPPMSAELAADQIERELGAPPDRLFLEWDEEPIAAASIGQVHRALTKDGKALAVKVQYPGVAKAVASDLGNAGWIFGGLATMFPGVEPAPIIDEIRSRLHEELDYTLEAQNQTIFHEYFVDHPFITVPAVHPEFSTSTVLSTDLVVGSKFSDVLDWSREERNLAAETLFRYSFGAIYELSSFNGDPHPGNYLFNPGGKVAFLDYGLVKKFVPKESKFFQDLIIAMVLEKDIPKFRSVLESTGILPAEAPFDNELIESYFEYYYRYVMNDELTLIDETYASSGVARLFNVKGPYGDLMKQLNIPPAFVVVQRITLGLMGLFADLEAEANWQRIAKELWPFVEGEPSTPMGEEIARWRYLKETRGAASIS